MLIDTLSAVAPVPNDAILESGLLFKADERPEKLNLGVGVYLNEEGRLPLLRSVAEAEKRMLERRSTHGYCPIPGLPEYVDAVRRLVFGEELLGELGPRIASVQALGGTGALHVASEFAREVLDIDHGYVPDPSWGNHRIILGHVGIEVGTYAYYDAAARKLVPDAMIDSLRRLPPQSLVVIHGCCHNPTGLDPEEADVKRLIEVIGERDHMPLIDMAYQGFGDDAETDASLARAFFRADIPVMLATSNSKNFSLYGERVGSLHVLAPDRDSMPRIQSKLAGGIIRREHSNSPRHGAAIVAEVLGDEALRKGWEAETAEMRGRVGTMRRALADEGHRLGVDFSDVLAQKGIFFNTGRTPAQMQRLREKWAVYGVSNGRICMAGLNHGNVARVAQALADVWEYQI